MRNRLGECLAASGLIDGAELAAAVAEQKRSGDRLGAVLIAMRLATEQQIANALASQLGFPLIDLTERPPDPAIVALIPHDLAQRAACIAVTLEDEALVVAMAEPLLFSLIQELETRTGRRIKEVVATESAIRAAVDTYYPADSSGVGGPTPHEDAASSDDSRQRGDAAAIVDDIVRLAGEMENPEIHIEPTDTAIVVRARTNGVLTPVWTKPLALQDEIVARLKLLAGLDVSEKLLPQNGKIEPGDTPSLSLRLSTLRTADGEKVVLRSPGRGASLLPLDDLGLSRTAATDLRHVLEESSGIVILAGPRGSGRSTTLAAVLAALSAAGRNIALVQRVIEHRIPGVTQIPADDAIGVPAGLAVAAALEQGADVIGLDVDLDAGSAAILETASSTVLVVAVVPANDAAEALGTLATFQRHEAGFVTRVRAILAQRLVRRLCARCRRERSLSSEDLERLRVASADVLNGPVCDPVGCDECDFIGYRGRIGLFELFRPTEAIRRLATGGAAADEIRSAARTAGLVTLAEAARSALEGGITSVDELRRAVADLRDARSMCAQCGTAVSPDFTVCPHCGSPVGGVCQHCGRALQRSWTFCPFCARTAEQASRPARRGIMRLVRNPDSSDPV